MEDDARKAVRMLANVLQAQERFLADLSRRVEQQGVILGALRSHLTLDQTDDLDKRLKEFAIQNQAAESSADGISVLSAELDRLLQ
jgi:hypothetical protein